MKPRQNAEMDKAAYLHGTVGPLRIGALRKACWECNANGWPVTLDVAPGWIARPFKVTGHPRAIKLLADYFGVEDE